MSQTFSKMKLIIVLGLMIFLHTACAQDPEIAETILPEIKLAGLTGRLQCVVINQMDNPVFWIHKDTQTEISQDDSITIDEIHNTIEDGRPRYEIHRDLDVTLARNTYTLTINRLERRDAGLYTCMILVRGDTRHPQKDGKLIVLAPPSIIQSETSHTITVAEGDDLKMHCLAEGYPTPNITWVRVNGGVLPDGRLRAVGESFNITNIDHRGRGIYRCLADNAVRPPAIYDTTVMVYFKPVARAVQTSYGQAENRMFDITIECTIAGFPDPDLQWYKVLGGGNLEPITNNDRYTVNILLNHANILSPQERWFQLVIRSVVANDYGDYICEGKNVQGRGNATVRIFATSECQGPNCPTETQPEGNSGSLGTASTTHITLLLTVILTLVLLVKTK